MPPSELQCRVNWVNAIKRSKACVCTSIYINMHTNVVSSRIKLIYALVSHFVAHNILFYTVRAYVACLSTVNTHQLSANHIHPGFLKIKREIENVQFVLYVTFMLSDQYEWLCDSFFFFFKHSK